MQHLSFTIWMLLYPLACTTEHYMSVKRKKLEGDDTPMTDSGRLVVITIEIIIWLGVATAIY